MKIPKEMEMLAGTAIGLMVFMVITGIGYIFGGVLKQVSGMPAAGNTTIDVVVAIFATITTFISIVVLWQIARIIIKGLGNK